MLGYCALQREVWARNYDELYAVFDPCESVVYIWDIAKSLGYLLESSVGSSAAFLSKL